MSSTRPLLALVASMFLAAPLVVACSGGDNTSTEDQASAPTDDEIKAGGGLGAKCTDAKKCKTGLSCKYEVGSSSSGGSGPPPGAMGMPVSSSSSGGPPPGAMGMPLLTGTCSEPDPGEEGGLCNSSIKCDKGLTCDYVKAPTSSGGRPVMGMPIRPHGKCVAK